MSHCYVCFARGSITFGNLLFLLRKLCLENVDQFSAEQEQYGISVREDLSETESEMEDDIVMEEDDEDDVLSEEKTDQVS